MSTGGALSWWVECGVSQGGKEGVAGALSGHFVALGV